MKRIIEVPKVDMPLLKSASTRVIPQSKDRLEKYDESFNIVLFNIYLFLQVIYA